MPTTEKTLIAKKVLAAAKALNSYGLIFITSNSVNSKLQPVQSGIISLDLYKQKTDSEKPHGVTLVHFTLSEELFVEMDKYFNYNEDSNLFSKR